MKIIKVLAYAFALTFCGWCIVTGSEAEDRREAIVMQQQAHDLQQMCMSRLAAGDMRYK